MAKALYRASVRGARSPGRNLSRAGRVIQGALLDEFGLLAPEATRITREFAPSNTGRSARTIKARVRSYGGRITLELHADFVNPDTGYDFLRVTRFGHRVAFIFPRNAKALRFVPRGAPGGKPIFRMFVRGYHPKRDWVEQAHAVVGDRLGQVSDRVGRQVATRLFR